MKRLPALPPGKGGGGVFFYMYTSGSNIVLRQLEDKVPPFKKSVNKVPVQYMYIGTDQARFLKTDLTPQH
jgi:hypothetical protein